MKDSKNVISLVYHHPKKGFCHFQKPCVYALGCFDFKKVDKSYGKNNMLVFMVK